MAIAPHCSQELHMVRERPGPAAHAMRSFGSCVQFALSRQTVSTSSERAYMLTCAAYMPGRNVAYLWCLKLEPSTAQPMRPTGFGATGTESLSKGCCDMNAAASSDAPR
jgi:hypothetical protein